MNTLGTFFGKLLKREEEPKQEPLTPNGVLPEGEYYTVLWGIADSYGGMTTVSLERTSAFAREDNRYVTILTFDPKLDPEERGERLRSQGFLDERVQIRNVWHDLRAWPDAMLQRMAGKQKPDQASASDILEAPAKKRGRRGIKLERRNAEGKLLQRDFYSEQGNIVLSDRLDMKVKGEPAGRRLALFNSNGEVIAQWASATSMYMAWMDVVLDGKRSYINVDSAFAANLFHRYRRKNVVVTSVLHNNHLTRDPKVEGELYRSKFPLFKNIGAYDALITLTQNQRRDLIEIGFPAGNLHRISNPTEDLDGDTEKPRDPRFGATLARLVSVKRVDHSIKAVALAGRDVPGLKLDIYGEGDEHDSLAELIEESGTSATITLKGHDQKAKKVYLDASFSLLTSVFEGQGLVVLESMSAGCIPIVYDIKYGPAEIITDGVDGFLVPPGDVEALAQTVAKVATMSQEELTTMRRAARKRAADFFEPNIVREWGQVLAELPFGAISRASFTAHAESVEFTGATEAEPVGIDPEGSFEVKIKVEATERGEAIDVPELEDLGLAWTFRGTKLYRRVPARIEGDTVTATIPMATFARLPKGVVDFSLVFRTGRCLYQPRVAAGNVELPLDSGRMRAYSTEQDNLSVRLRTVESSDSAAV